MRRLPHAAIATLASLAAGWLSPAAAEDVPVDLELVLAVDVSWSMDTDEQELQRAGYAAAFRDAQVLEAIAGGGYGRIAVAYVEWAGAPSQRVVVPWTLVDGAESAEGFARALEAVRIGRLRRTSISGALAFSYPLFEGNGYEGVRRVVDVSGDGANNQGAPVEIARDLLVSDGITINGLPIMIKPGDPGGFMSIANLDVYYEDCVIGGPSAFIVPVTDASLFAVAIRRKMILEIAGQTPRAIPAQFKRRAPRVDCLVGEKMWQERRRSRDGQ
jgi:hypothetical protein